MDINIMRQALSPTSASDTWLAECLPHMEEAMRAAQINNPRRASAWYSQIGHESAGLRYMAEIKTSDPSWSWDRTRYRGRGPIQLTWQGNYRKFGQWCKDQGYINDPELFVNQPELVEQPKWGFLAASWYWLCAGPRPGQINGFADVGDIVAVSRCINGWIETKLPNGMPDRQQRWDHCLALGDAIVPGNITPPKEIPVTWTGDPVWLEEVLRPALGDRLKTLPGWQNSGHGDFKDIRGVMVHHTGDSRESAQSIRNGRPDLAGPLANIHIAPDGTVTIVAVGVCWHAGQGSYPWLPTNNANAHMIGIECAWPTPRPDLPKGYDPAERWPDAQIISMRDTCAALALKLELPATRVIGHKEWAGAAQGKWDPGNLDMSWFRGEVRKDMEGFVFPGEHPPIEPQPGPTLPPDYAKETWDQLRIQWPQLGGRTLVDAVAVIGEKLGIEGFYDVKKTQS
ncbi:endolysin [Mycobacterium phage Che9d]|uniref:N-acetylmuramoyl-L-alanine amidase n=1 Tax=Mycobacterium phage Che9d TaxID=2907834 RepID=Q855S8_9CAUD|nr:endolysin [Mycobacterium phage Che9d]AAN07953.1 lysin A [Mycobacterium phage Che9d]